MTENELATIIIGAAIDVHKHLGPGLLENAYEHCLVYELKEKGLKVTRQERLPIAYKEVKLEAAYRLDLVVEETIIVELKAVVELTPLHLAQLHTYLKLRELKLGLLINFNTVLLKNGVKRVVNGL
jgi:GxxExxY protein